MSLRLRIAEERTVEMSVLEPMYGFTLAVLRARRERRAASPFAMSSFRSSSLSFFSAFQLPVLVFLLLCAFDCELVVGNSLFLPCTFRERGVKHVVVVLDDLGKVLVRFHLQLFLF